MKCVGCGDELPDERAALGFEYCVKKQCVKDHMKPLRMLAVAVNKSADQFVLFDEEAKKKAEAGEYRKDSRKQSAISPSDMVRVAVERVVTESTTRRPSSKSAPARKLPGRPDQWTRILIYNQQGIKPDEIATLVGMSRYDVTQVILAKRGKNSS